MVRKSKEADAAYMRDYRKRKKAELLEHLKTMAAYSRIVRASFLYHVTNFGHRNHVSFNTNYGES